MLVRVRIPLCLLVAALLVPCAAAPGAPGKRKPRPSRSRPEPEEKKAPEHPLAPLDYFLGEWTGEGSGIQGDFDVKLGFSHTHELAGSYTACRWERTYRDGPEARRRGSDSALGYYGFDKTSGRIVLSLFQSDGIALDYAGRFGSHDTTFVLDLVSGWNIPEDFHARITTVVDSPTSFREIYEWSPPGKALARYMEIRYTRVGGCAGEEGERQTGGTSIDRR